MILNGANGAAKGSDGMMEYFKNLTEDEIKNNWKQWDFTEDFVEQAVNGSLIGTSFGYRSIGDGEYRPDQLVMIAVLLDHGGFDAGPTIVFPFYDETINERYSGIRLTLASNIDWTACCDAEIAASIGKRDGTDVYEVHIVCNVFGTVTGDSGDYDPLEDGGPTLYMPVVYYKVF